jgi:formiminoglutamase
MFVFKPRSMSLSTIYDFLEPVNLFDLTDDEGFKQVQLGKHTAINEGELPDISEADLVIVGCNEWRGDEPSANKLNSADEVRKQLYALYHWHADVKLADVGNVKSGASLKDSYAALKTVIQELVDAGKRVLIIGGSHDLTLAQYQSYADVSKIIEAVCVDAAIDLNWEDAQPAKSFLMEMLTSEPNFLRHYNHIGFQSYLVHPNMLETIDKLRFDCYRVGRVKENIEEMEPVVRNAQLFSFDIAAIQNAHAPANHLTPNGLTGEEACTLMQYAGMSPNVNTIGIYGFNPSKDSHSLTAKQISHMIWYVMDGIHRGKTEASLEHTDDFNEFKMAFSEVEATFLQSKKTGRWWMQMPDGKYIACSYADYALASSNEIPERWMRAMERS